MKQEVMGKVEKKEESSNFKKKEHFKTNNKPDFQKGRQNDRDRDFKQKERWGVAHIYASFNNTLLHVTDITGSETITMISGGHVVSQGRLESGPAAAIKIAKIVVEKVKERGITGLHIRIRAPGGNSGHNNPGPGNQIIVKQLQREGLRIGVIEEVTPLPYDGCSRKGRKKSL